MTKYGTKLTPIKSQQHLFNFERKSDYNSKITMILS